MTLAFDEIAYTCETSLNANDINGIYLPHYIKMKRITKNY